MQTFGKLSATEPL